MTKLKHQYTRKVKFQPVASWDIQWMSVYTKTMSNMWLLPFEKGIGNNTKFISFKIGNILARKIVGTTKNFKNIFGVWNNSSL